LTYDGASTSIGVLISNGANSTISVANSTTLSWLTIGNITKAGAGTLSATSSYDLGTNSGWTSITNPVGGGGPPPFF
jgi:hypothetical protein